MKRNHKSPKNEENGGTESIEIQINSGITQSNEKLIERNNRKQFSYSAVFNVLVSFHQLQSLLQVPVDHQNQKPFNFLVSNFFNLDIMLKRADKYCPSKSISVIYSDALKNFPTIKYCTHNSNHNVYKEVLRIFKGTLSQNSATDFKTFSNTSMIN